MLGAAGRKLSVEGGSSWVSMSHWSHRTVSSSAPIAPNRAQPAKGGVVVIQEIFGVNHHIRAVCDRSRPRLHRRGAGAVRSRRAEFRMRLFAADESPRPASSSRRSRLGGDDARHPGGDRRSQDGRPGRHHRLLHGRHDRVPRGRASSTACRRRSAITAARSPRTPTRSRECRRSCTSARRTRRSR